MNTDKANRLHPPRVVVSPDCLEGAGKSLFRAACWGSGQQGSGWQAAPRGPGAPVAGVDEGGREAAAPDPGDLLSEVANSN